mmetsp:Transcript_21606/g.50449  ORF Transcript_21606/g.50449 Transcript_21606/m.50449 type:complete len:382 (-) Transcript_21606:95-1240(-)
MGNGGSFPEGPREVVLYLQSVHNVPHASDDVYYGMATDHISESEKFITSEKSVRFVVDRTTILSIRVFLHKRGSASAQDRAVGQVSLPIGQIVELMGRGLYQTWLLLEEVADYAGIRRSWVVEHFRNAYSNVRDKIHAPRICITLLEVDADPQLWSASETDRAEYHDVVLASQTQLTKLLAAYHSDRVDADRGQAMSATLSMDSAGSDAVAHLQEQLKYLTAEAKKREESGIETVRKLEDHMREMRQASDAAWHDRTAARRRLEAAKWRNNQLQEHISAPSSGDESELTQLASEMNTLLREKEACMKMVQDIYTVAERGGVDHVLSPVHSAAARHLLEIRSCGVLGLEGAMPKVYEDAPHMGGNMLPDPEELLGDLPLDPL